MHLPIIDQLTDGTCVYHCRCDEYFDTEEALMTHFRERNQ